MVFCLFKRKNTTAEMKEGGKGDVWTWTALDADSKLIVSWFVRNRDAEAHIVLYMMLQQG